MGFKHPGKHFAGMGLPGSGKNARKGDAATLERWGAKAALYAAE
jgi:hypothetical protein